MLGFAMTRSRNKFPGDFQVLDSLPVEEKSRTFTETNGKDNISEIHVCDDDFIIWSNCF